MSRGFDSHFGPPSQPISVAEFLQEANSALLSGSLTNASWEQLTPEYDNAAEAEISGSISELKSSLEQVWDNPVLSAHVLRQHESTVAAVRGQADAPAPKGRKRKRYVAPEGSESAPEVLQLQEKLDAVNLKCWGLTVESALCMRAAKNSDYNALDAPKKTGTGVLRTINHGDVGATRNSTPDSLRSPSPNATSYLNAVISLTVYNRITYLPSCLTRSSQHAVLSTQTLDDLLRVIPCASSNMPIEHLDAEGDISGYNLPDQTGEHSGSLFCIEGLVYGDRSENTDYAEKLIAHFQKLPEGKRPKITKASTSASETAFSALTLRIHQPYWILHQGNCEHFFVIDQIRHGLFHFNSITTLNVICRLAHPSDPPSGYPLMLHLTPTLQDLCRACGKVPAVHSIVGDMRLGESPCLLCAPCWRTMGPPKNDEDVMVVPLVIHP
ncbi:snRNA-activating protein of 50kDa MW C terminal-domain-containing protein [Suillus clintonianus]|uniref:snRNA-activating protein of 50kDa MW C terminal-domain-containing protein n=1 Tax=Suillus clintonianus TaxID=1904413 RepID=UPI001B8830EB|nr:snRNA-activating protein of 50kDa MW C terminal-domain-containing protein [Suillus clintonianus]KAG2150536.1 snRNA-activating protein of 50kDa MW C terminal-domain-containing protein [Suillus clintonianus]